MGFLKIDKIKMTQMIFSFSLFVLFAFFNLASAGCGNGGPNDPSRSAICTVCQAWSNFDICSVSCTQTRSQYCGSTRYLESDGGALYCPWSLTSAHYYKYETINCTGGDCIPPLVSGIKCNSTGNCTTACPDVAASDCWSASDQASCDADCSPPDTSGYKCNSSTGSCYAVSSGRDFTSLNTCDANCSPPDTSGYKCNSSTGSCYAVSSGRDLTSLNTCDANC